MATREEVNRCIELVGNAAKKNYPNSKVLPSIIVAQACLESGYLTSELARKANNCFGIKWTAYKTPSKYNYRSIDWAIFNSIEECVIQHGVYYNSKPHFYAELMGETDLDKALTALDESPYCADAGYKEKLLKLINQYDLTKFDDVRGENKMKIVIDPGHRNNLSDCGAMGNGLKESELALSISKLLKAELEAIGLVCSMTRNSESESISVSDRPKKARQLGADLLISVHINSAGSTAEGIEVLYKSQKSLAEKVCAGMVAATGARNRGAKQRTDLGVLNGFDKSILIECGFISNPKEAKLMNTKEYQKKLVKGIVEGVAKEFGLKVPAGSSTPEVKEDADLIKAVNDIIAIGVQVNAASWNNVSRMNLKYVPGLLNKLGGVNSLVEKGIISSGDIWENGTYTEQNVRSLLIKYSKGQA